MQQRGGYGKHFLMYSKKYREKGGASRFGSDEILQRRTLVSRFLDGNFQLLSPHLKNVSEIQREAEKIGLSNISRATIQNDIFLLKTAREYLLSGSSDQIIIRRDNQKRRWIIFAFDCLDDDGISSWEELEKLRVVQEEKEESPAPEEEDLAETPETAGISTLKVCHKIQNLSDQLQELSTGFCNTFPNFVQELTDIAIPALESSRKKNIALLDENCGLSETNRALESKLLAGLERIAVLEKDTNDQGKRLENAAARLLSMEKLLLEKDQELESTIKELARVRKKAGEKIARLTKENRKLAQSFSAEIIRRALAYEELAGEDPPEQEILNQEAAPSDNMIFTSFECGEDSEAESGQHRHDEASTPPVKKQDAEELLPIKYVPTGGKVVPQDCFLDFMKKLETSNRNRYSDVINKLHLICELGVGGVPFRIKTISESTNNTPKNSKQMAVGKYRIMMGLEGINFFFYEMFPRKEPPYGSRTRN